MNQTLRLTAIFTVSIWFLASCSRGQLGKDIGMVVLPSKVIIGPASQFTCVDKLNAIATPSAPGPVIVFPKFVIDWKHPTNVLMPQSIRVTVTGAGIRDRKYVFQVLGDELTALVGSIQVQPNKIIDISNTSTDPRVQPRSTTACMLVIGGVPLANGDKTNSFKARVRIELIGSSLSSDYTSQEFVQQSVEAEADYIKL